MIQTPKIKLIAPDDSVRSVKTLRTSKASSIRSGSATAIRKSLKKVEFADTLNDRLENSTLIFKTNNNNNNNSSTANLNFGTNKSIRRVKESDFANINIPDFQINLNHNTDDILQQLKSNLSQNI